MQGILWLYQEQSATSDKDTVYREIGMSTERIGTYLKMSSVPGNEGVLKS
jgi:hypothetical protein